MDEKALKTLQDKFKETIDALKTDIQSIADSLRILTDSKEDEANAAGDMKESNKERFLLSDF